MGKRTDIESILVIGSGPIVIGQAAEFDYSGVQACKALKEDGYRVILINSNPATIMTDPEFSDKTYIEPITADILEKIIQEEKPDALLPTLGGQTALNMGVELAQRGILDALGIEMLGAKIEAIKKAEDRQLFKEEMIKVGLDIPRSGIARNMEEAREVAAQINQFPLIIRPAFTLGGQGGSIAYNREEFEAGVIRGLGVSPIGEILIEEGLLGWKEFEMEVMRDRKDSCVVICSIENMDPMGVHTGDSITVAPAQTLTDEEYQKMRDWAFTVIRQIGVETGGSNIQFAVDPKTGRMVVIEMNPRVSRSSALASKATGFPIAKIAAKLAVGYTLDEIANDITRKTLACFEPAIDYVVVKIPRFTFEKFPEADPTLSSSMKSVGEVMAIGRTFKESLQKALRSLEVGAHGLSGGTHGHDQILPLEQIRHFLLTPRAERIFYIRHAFRAGMDVETIASLSGIDPWFLSQIEELVQEEAILKQSKDPALLVEAKMNGFSDKQLAHLWNLPEEEIRALRKKENCLPTYRLVDTCAAEFEAYTPYYYSTYEPGINELEPNLDDPKIIILGAGPNRIGQGIEFDYCCVHALMALRQLGYKTIMINSNPETVSTDYDSSDFLFFEPLTAEDVIQVYETTKAHGLIIQFGGQTPLNLANPLKKAGVKILGTSVESIEMAEDRRLFSQLVSKLGLRQPQSLIITDVQESLLAAKKIGFPLLLRPSYVLGGRAMHIVYTESDLVRFVEEAIEAAPEKPILVDHFLEDAIEVDIDCVSDGEDIFIGAILEHIELAGVHSGDSACVLPPFSLSENIKEEIRRTVFLLARELNVVGLMNVQFAVQKNNLYILEVNPRASRTVPFISKSIGVPLAKLATQVIMGKKLKELGYVGKEIVPPYYCVKEAVFPFDRFPGVDILLGPEMKSTGEVMGIDDDLGIAYAKTQIALNAPLPLKGKVFLSVRDQDKKEGVEIARSLVGLGFEIVATEGTARALHEAGVKCTKLYKLSEGRPNVLDMIKNGEISLVINTPSGSWARKDEIRIRTTSLYSKIPVMTTMAAARATVAAIKSLQSKEMHVKPLQHYHAELNYSRKKTDEKK
ncbi:carbamoyl-phosphate synthase large subunit [Candidatus Methylacidiphilum infernorum]|uniref:Carbamoyl phosphate synthase large chain n=1 Tax=Candidatus Methylacidiphilum infernorum TaxID=511746 RepID=A0ABX7PWW7_9BACT|nr:carbamoyl-phosphate synthase large subunit [Candidatus Methylacidiphilum infernorum]QSR87402.1 carbamoyl-phosphate synthase large subunit [Candidatus Methylacidiphilum infernorum]